MLQGFLLLSALPGGIGTRFQFFRSLVPRRSIQPVESFCKALWVSSAAAAAAETSVAKTAMEKPSVDSRFTYIVWSPRIGGTKCPLPLRSCFDDRVKHSDPLPVPLVFVDETPVQ